MANIGDIGRRIAENESLLSGLVALVVLVGLILSPVGKGIRRLYARYGQTESSTAGPEPIPPTNPAATTQPLLAVLAFDNLSSDPEMEFFSDGVSEEIIRRLSRGAQLKVIGRTSLLFQAGMPEMRNDLQFVRLCARLGLVEYWMTTGKWPDCTDEVPYDFKAECAKVEHIPKDDFGI